ncbi:hypothetical protein K461DRAFT_246231 [Myriangium duriaei CBS 260.36]|uniref:non-specific serine/threonine protein kinase n=1 Tax=Myriangium duriaei CBS 260.36 TaxID=1168546 RepID=A0A9P4MD32_9PEZI|nr:hypothetical protein K461DRAFT_246231 [Myriangium duriaei CBS 260.36]
MGTRNFVQTPINYDKMAMNAAMYGFAQHSMLTPHHDVKQLWWTEKRIEARVDKKFVMSSFHGPERAMLEEPVGFGGDLSDDTYLSWILDRARRLFLILNQIRCANRIFDLIDDSWQDDDLPLSRAEVKQLRLASENDEQLNRRFHEAQFQYLLRPITQGSHIDYGPNEYISMEYVNTVPHAVILQRWNRIHFPEEPNKVFIRRRFELTADDNIRHELDFLEDVQRSRFYQHEHIARIWASYTSDGSGYTLYDHVPTHTLRTFIDHRTPPQFTKLSKAQRPCLLLEWMHCLADTIAYLHHRGDYHGVIRPSNILIDEDNRIAFADLGRLRTFHRDKTVFKEETRDYSAPELKGEPIPKPPTFSPSFEQSDSSSFYANVGPLSPRLSHTSSISSAISVSAGPSFSCSSAQTSPRNFSRHFEAIRKDSGHDLERHVTKPPSPPRTPSFVKDGFSDFGSVHTATYSPRQSRTSSPQQASDVFSLGCVYLDILTFLVHGKLNPLLKLRNKKHPSSTPTPDTASISSHKSNSSGSEPFHASMERLDAWLHSLRKASDKHPPALASCIAELLRIVRMMLAPTPGMRPSAMEVRNALEATLTRDVGIEDLCCHARNWDMAGAVTAPQGLTDAIARCKQRAVDAARESSDESPGEGTVSPRSWELSRQSTRRSSYEVGGEGRERKGSRGLFRSLKGPVMKLP